MQNRRGDESVRDHDHDYQPVKKTTPAAQGVVDGQEKEDSSCSDDKESCDAFSDRTADRKINKMYFRDESIEKKPTAKAISYKPKLANVILDEAEAEKAGSVVHTTEMNEKKIAQKRIGLQKILDRS